jgi:cysteinyl-tRNA synthetase
MSSDILGDEFDIHGGGIDLIFPHHENEIAQSEGAGKKFARYWIHHGLLTINGQKMSKSLGNFITVQDCLNKYSSDALKILFLSTHYTHPVDYTEQKMQDAEKEIERIKILFHRIEQIKKAQITGKGEPVDFVMVCKKKFEEEMDNDFNTPRALAAIFELISNTNKFLDNQEYDAKVTNAVKATITELTSVLGVSLDNKGEFSSEKEDYIGLKIRERNEARKNKDFKKSDDIRKELEDKGIILEDTKDGTTWRKKL